MKHAVTTLAVLGGTALLAACGGADADRADADRPAPPAMIPTEADTPNRQAVNSYGSDPMQRDAPSMMKRSFDVVNSSGNAIGTVTIADTADGVDVMLDVTAIPAGPHAIHFHEVGSCDGPDFTSAGGHYNPSGVNHGFEASAPNPHAGDMRNFDAPRSGVVKTTLDNERVSLSERTGMAPLMDANGTALIIHAGADDYQSQPSGAAGGRIACAVIAG